MNHFIIKLVTGESIYGKVDSDNIDNKMLIVTDPLIWEEYFTDDGSSGSTLIKYCSGSDDNNIPVMSNAVISMARMSSAFSDFYDAAVELQNIMEHAYDDRLAKMTIRMKNTLLSHYAQTKQQETNDIVSWYPIDTEDTIH